MKSTENIIEILAACNLHGLILQENNVLERSNEATLDLLNEEKKAVVSFSVNPDDNTHFNVKFLEEDKLLYPLLYDKKCVQGFIDLYLSDQAVPENPPFGADMLADVIRLRDEETKPAYLTDGRSKRFFIGFGDWEEFMTGVENYATFNYFLKMRPICIATPLNTNVAQWRTAFSQSLFSVYRFYIGNMETTIFYAILEYIPCSQFIDLTEQFLKKNFANSPLGGLPPDIPVDLIYALTNFKFDVLWDKETLSKYIWENSEHSYGYTNSLSAITSDDEFEQTFMLFTEHPDISVRNFIAWDALIVRKNQKIYDKVKAIGISNEMYDYLKSEGLPV